MENTARKVTPALVLAGLLLPLLAMAYAGLYSRYMADDYCTASRALSDGVIGSALWWYNNWAGQFTNWLAKGAAAYMGPGLTSVLPALVLVAWTAAAAWAIYQLLLVFRLPQPRFMALALGALVVFAVFDGTPSRIQSLYWMGAVIPYTIPLIALSFLAGYFVYTLRRSPGRIPSGALAVFAVVTFVAGGLSEVYVAFQIAILGLTFLGFLLFAPPALKRPALALLAVGLVCSLAAMFIILAAPGNANRRAQFPDPLPLPVVAWRTLYITFSYAATAAGLFSPVAIIVSALLPMLLFYRLHPLDSRLRLSPRAVRRLLVLSAAITFILIAACLAPPIYTMSVAPAARVYIMPQLALVGAAVFWGSVMGLGARRQQPVVKPRAQIITGVVIAALLVGGPLLAAGHILAELPDYRAFAAEWDSRDQAIRADAESGEKHIVTTMLQVDLTIRAGLEPLGPEAEKGMNACAALYYGVETLTARTLLQMGDKSAQGDA